MTTLTRWRIGGALLPPALFLLMAASGDRETTRIAGTFKLTYSQQHVAPLVDAPGHMLALFEAKGTNQSTGATVYMDGAEVINTETLDLAQGTGLHQGYVAFAKEGDTAYTKWSGKVTTTLDAAKAPVTTFTGSWKKVGGSGRYSSVTGSGTYKGKMNSKLDYTVDWEGTLSGPSLSTR